MYMTFCPGSPPPPHCEEGLKKCSLGPLKKSQHLALKFVLLIIYLNQIASLFSFPYPIQPQGPQVYFCDSLIFPLPYFNSLS